ncbi:MAG: methyltransferase domain-containing protein [Chitinophagaceae bacterium]|nr:methyltransferase domain-containing protein [Chitinophagaceae bacterium]
MNTSIRHPGPELMDGTNIPDKDLFLNYQELHSINKLLGGYRITLKGLKKIAQGVKQLSILDVGCGGGDMMKIVAEWGRKNKIQMELTGVDVSASAIQYSKENCKKVPEIECMQADVFQHLNSGKKYDVIMNTLFMHHFNDDEIVRLLKLMKTNATKGCVINDLQRHSLACYSIQSLTKLFSKSYLVKNDAPLSVLRGFRREDWLKLLSNALIDHAEISWEWAFRYLVIFRNYHQDSSTNN